MGSSIVTGESAARRGVLAACLLACGLLFLLNAWIYAGPFEDAYIGYRYAENLAAGHGVVFNPGERVEGYTNFLWIVVLAGARLVGFSLPVAGPLLSIGAGLALLGTTYHLGRRAGLPGGFALAPVLFLAVNPDFALWAASGMETALFTLLGTATLLACLAAPERFLLGGILAAATALARPDGVLVALAVGIARLADRRPRKETAGFAGVFALLFGGYFAFRWSWYGWFWPNTFYAKVGSTAALVPLGLTQLASWSMMFGTWLVVPAVAVLAWRRRLGRGDRLLALFVLLTLAYVVMVGGDIFKGYRFFVPVLPATYVLLVRGGAALASRPSATSSAPVVAVALSLLFAIFTGTAFLSRRGDWGPPSMLDFLTAKQGITGQYFTVADYLREHFDDETTLALNAVGVIPEVTGFVTYDMLGLTDGHISHRPAEIGKGLRGHEKHDAAYILSREPDVIVLGFPMLTPEPLPAGDLAAWAAHFELPGDAELVRDPRIANYRPVRVALGEDGYFNYLVNRQTAQLRERDPGERDRR